MTLTQSIILYMSVMVFTGVSVYISKIKKENRIWRYSFLTIAFVPIFFIMAFRYDVGTDYFYTYIPAFNKIANKISAFKNEPGFTLMYKVLQMFTMQSQSIIILTSGIYAFFLIWLLDESSENPIISICVLFLMGYFFIALNNIRQQLAALIILWGFRFIKKNNFGGYLATVVTCMYFFHISCFFLLFLYPIVNSKILRKYCFIWMPILLLLSPVLVDAFYFCLKMFGYNYENNPSFNAPGGNYILVIQNSIMLFILLVGFRKDILKDRIIFGLFVIQFLALEVSVMTYWLLMLEIPDRVASYFMIYQVISVPIAVNRMFKWNWQVSMFVFTLLCWLCVRSFATTIVVYGYHEVLPYQFCFDRWEELKVKKPEEKVKINSVEFGGTYELSYTYSPNNG